MATFYLKTTKKSVKSGFTLVELSLSIAFIAVLSIAVVLIITNTVSSYHRGLTLSQLNTTGMDLVNDMRSSIQNSVIHSVFSSCSSTYNNPDTEKACTDDKVVSVDYESNVQIGDRIGSSVKVPVFGAFCTGNYTYIWNSGYFFSDDYKVDGTLPAELKYNLSGTTSNSEPTTKSMTGFKLLKVKDESRSICISAVYGDPNSGGKYNNNPINQNSNVFDITSYGAIVEEPMEIIDNDSNMAVYNISSALPAESTSGNNAFYSVSFILGTVHGGINVKTIGNYCATPEGYDASVANFDYCAINKFNYATRAVGG